MFVSPSNNIDFDDDNDDDCDTLNRFYEDSEMSDSIKVKNN